MVGMEGEGLDGKPSPHRCIGIVPVRKGPKDIWFLSSRRKLPVTSDDLT